MAMEHDGARLIQDAEIHGTGVQVDAAVIRMLLGIKSHRGFLLDRVPNLPHTPWYAEGEASISIKGLQPTRLTSAVSIGLRRCSPAAVSIVRCSVARRAAEAER
jgi:hypothetical protein